jgi:hypothetical protein
MVRTVLLLVVLALGAGNAAAQVAETGGPAAAPNDNGRGETIAKFLAGGALGLVAHEGAHLVFDVIFDADPRLTRVDFHGIPFFAIAHRPDLPRRQAFVIASAGFWVQHAGSEWLLTRRPGIRHEYAPVAKGVLAFNIIASMAYAGAAFARTGPPERDTRGMALASRTDERVIGALVLAPAVLDAWRYFEPDRAWLKWTSRAVKAGMVLLVIR